MTSREIFDKVKKALLSQGKRSKGKDFCLYCSPTGLKCAIGHLIPEEKYTDEIEGMSITEFPDDILQCILPSDKTEKDGIDFLVELQNIHDLTLPSKWKKEFDQAEEDFLTIWYL